MFDAKWWVIHIGKIGLCVDCDSKGFNYLAVFDAKWWVIHTGNIGFLIYGLCGILYYLAVFDAKFSTFVMVPNDK